MTLFEETEFLTIDELVQESVELVTEVVNHLYHGIAKQAGVKSLATISISKDFDRNDAGFYSAGISRITLNAVKLQNESIEHIAFVLAHEVYHHKQWEDGERFESYISHTEDVISYKMQRVEQEANDFAESLFPRSK